MAQYGAEFEVNSEVGCNPFTVVVNDLSGAPDTIAINYDWGDGSPLDSTEFHTYPQPGLYTIIQTVANANPRQDTVIVEVINQYPPEFYLFNCKGTVGSVMVQDTLYEAFEIDWDDSSSDIVSAYSLISHDYGIVSTFDVTVKGLINGTQSPTDSSNLNCYSTTKRLNMINSMLPANINQIAVLITDATSGSISVDYTLAPDNNYLIEIKNQNQATFTILDTINQILNPNSYIIENLNTADNYYCVSITSFDPCDGDMIQSNIGCSINIQTTGGNQQNVIDWGTNSTDFLDYSLYKDGSLIATINTQVQNQYLDNQVNCGITYQYLVRMMENGGFLSISDTSTVTSISTDMPDPVENISATVLDQDIKLEWEEPQNFLAIGYIISRSTDGVQYNVLDTLTTAEYLDTKLFTQSTRYFYKIVYYDACGNLSEESIISSQVLLVREFDLTLTWSDYEGWVLGVSAYTLEKYDENGQLLESLPLDLSTSYQEDQSANAYQHIIYKIVASPIDLANGNVESNLLEIIYPSKVAFPNAFSPNGDGLNDIFNFESRYVMSANMKIYTRWGELVYQTTDVDRGWDGNANGKPAPFGTYIYHTTLTDDMGITFVKSGEIVLIR
jgi:gliding motility-associated-like protein